MTAGADPVTPDGRYLVVRGRLWRRSDPSLTDEHRSGLVAELMSARRAVGVALRGKDSAALADARTAIHRAKTALGERGAVWWRDGAPDLRGRERISRPPVAKGFAMIKNDVRRAVGVGDRPVTPAGRFRHARLVDDDP